MLTDQEQTKLDAIKDNVAYNEYGLWYSTLTDSQRIHLTDLIAIEYHRQMSEPKQDNDLFITIKPIDHA